MALPTSFLHTPNSSMPPRHYPRVGGWGVGGFALPRRITKRMIIKKTRRDTMGVHMPGAVWHPRHSQNAPARQGEGSVCLLGQKAQECPNPLQPGGHQRMSLLLPGLRWSGMGLRVWAQDQGKVSLLPNPGTYCQPTAGCTDAPHPMPGCRCVSTHHPSVSWMRSDRESHPLGT